MYPILEGPRNLASWIRIDTKPPFLQGSSLSVTVEIRASSEMALREKERHPKTIVSPHAVKRNGRCVRIFGCSKRTIIGWEGEPLWSHLFSSRKVVSSYLPSQKQLSDSLCDNTRVFLCAIYVDVKCPLGTFSKKKECSGVFQRRLYSSFFL